MKKSAVYACLGIVIVFCLAYAVLLFTAPRLLDMYAAYRLLFPKVQNIVLTAYYACCIPAGCSLVCLLLLLQNVRKEQLFIRSNCRLIGLVSWCCLLVALITAVAGFWYMPLFFITVAMVFIFLILRVIRSCFQAATELKEENSLTI